MKRPLKVGFDLDGVILYNPIRVLRPLSALISKLIFKKKTTSFFIPQNPIAKFAWYLLHKTSFIPARGLNDLRKLVKEGKVEAHLITGRYSSLTHDFQSWMKSLNSEHLFASQSHNVKNEQPHIFKQNMIKKLGLDIFVEDNWDIVKELKVKSSPNAQSGSAILRNREKFKIFWITNLLDHRIPHEHKFHNLKSVVNYLKVLTK